MIQLEGFMYSSRIQTTILPFSVKGVLRSRESAIRQAGVTVFSVDFKEETRLYLEENSCFDLLEGTHQRASAGAVRVNIGR